MADFSERLTVLSRTKASCYDPDAEVTKKKKNFNTTCLYIYIYFIPFSFITILFAGELSRFSDKLNL